VTGFRVQVCQLDTTRKKSVATALRSRVNLLHGRLFSQVKAVFASSWKFKDFLTSQEPAEQDRYLLHQQVAAAFAAEDENLKQPSDLNRKDVSEKSLMAFATLTRPFFDQLRQLRALDFKKVADALSEVDSDIFEVCPPLEAGPPPSNDGRAVDAMAVDSEVSPDVPENTPASSSEPQPTPSEPGEPVDPEAPAADAAVTIPAPNTSDSALMPPPGSPDSSASTISALAAGLANTRVTPYP
jgi:hypothetical protein